MNTAKSKTAILLAGFGLLSGASLAGSGLAQATGDPQVGSPNTATADPTVSRPRTQPVKVPLFSGLAFSDFSPKTFSYTPPAEAKPWAKVVLVADFSVNAGRQFDRTAQISIGKTNVYFGTTPEPSAAVSRTWHVERDLTDYSALLRTDQAGEVDLGNLVDDTYTGLILGSAYLLFYPTDRQTPAPETPDVVLPLPNATGGAAGLPGTTSTLTETFTFPTNVVRAYLDVITQSQGGDEFWYTSVPDSLTSELESTGGTAFREAEITVDGRPAGVAPVYPWIYTGGIDPYLWRPIPGVQALNFVPYRVDLTPFSGIFDDGQPHQVGIQVFNSNNYFQAVGALLLYRDPALQTVTGALTADTLSAAPAPVIRQNIVTDADGDVRGPVSVTSARQFTISGYVLTSKGRVETQLAQSILFSNRQQFTITAAQYVQNIRQNTQVFSATTTRAGSSVQQRQQSFSYPLSLDYSYVVNDDGSAYQTTAVKQGYQAQDEQFLNGVSFFASVLSDKVTPTDTLLFGADGSLTGKQGQQSAQAYSFFDTLGNRYSRSISAANGLLTSVTSGKFPGSK